MGNVFVVDNGFQIALYAAYGGFQFMGYVLCQLAFQAYLFFLLCDVINGDFKTQVLEDDAFYDEYTPVFINVDGQSFFFFIRRASLRLADEVGNFLKLTDREYLFSGL